MCRLMECRAKVGHERLVEQRTEHLEVLDLLEAEDDLGASGRLRKHLDGALNRETPLAWSWTAEMT